jgi:tRNA A37 threonylcarbamoyladenosine modification protein TsaB
MVLLIDTSDENFVRLKLSAGSQSYVHKFNSRRDLSERLIPEIERFLKKSKVGLNQLQAIKIAPSSAGFSRIRTGAAVANALGYALGIKQALIRPRYYKIPNITKPA